MIEGGCGVVVVWMSESELVIKGKEIKIKLMMVTFYT